MDSSQTITATLTLPGWLNSGQDHWQTRWEQLHGAQRVQQDNWEQPLRGDWLSALEEHMLVAADHAAQNTIDGTPTRFAVAAHSLGCHLLAAWAAHSSHAHWVVAALLVAPPDLSQTDISPAVARWHPPEVAALPFKAVVWGSDNDTCASWDSTQAIAAQWGASTVCMAQGGHINADTGLGDWPQGWQSLQALMA